MVAAQETGLPASGDDTVKATSTRTTGAKPSPARLEPERANRVWVDVSTLLRWQGRWTGIPRTLASILGEWLQVENPTFSLCRFDQAERSFGEVPREQVRELYAAQTRSLVAPATSSPGLARRWLPADLADACAECARALGHLGRSTLRLAGAPFRARKPSAAGLPIRSPSVEPFARGDVLLSAGGSWEHPGYLESVRTCRHQVGLRVVPLIYDLIPHRFPHFFGPEFPPTFRTWLAGLLPLADRIVTISRSSRDDLLAFARESGASCPPIDVIRLGDRFPCSDVVRPPALVVERGLTDASFALSVGTVEVRKNHALLYHVWRRLAEEHGAALPPLVIAGQRGWLCDDLQYQIRFDPVVRDRLLLLEGLSDGELTWLYRHCLFTLYPSHHEGWGLPVAESLAHGKPCIASNRASLPEIAGDLVEQHDPLDFAGCKALVSRALFEEGHRQQCEERIRRCYRETSWADCARDLGATLADLAGSGQARPSCASA